MPQPPAISTALTRSASPKARRGQRPWALTAALIPVMLLAGCIPEPKVGFDSPAPSKRLDAIVQASELEDDESLVRLVEKLRSHAPAERMFAIRSLEKRTGTTLDFDHAAPHWQRIEAYNRWLVWLENGGIALPEGMEPIETPEVQPEAQPDAGPDSGPEATPEGSGAQQPMEKEQPKG